MKHALKSMFDHVKQQFAGKKQAQRAPTRAIPRHYELRKERINNLHIKRISGEADKANKR